MSDAETPPQSPNVTALIDALDARARQAGNEGAATLVSGMLATLAESLAGVDRRLEMIEESTARLGAADLVENVQSNLATFNARLGRLEEAFVQAVNDSGSGTQEVVDQIRDAVLVHLREEVATRVDRLQQAIDARPVAEMPRIDFPDVGAALRSELGPLESRLAAIESRPAPEFPKVELPDVAAAVKSALGPLESRLAAIESRPAPEFPKVELPDVGAAVSSALGPLESRLAAIESRPAPLFPDVAALVRLALAPAMDRLRALESRPAPEFPKVEFPDVAAAVKSALGPLESRLAAIESRPAPEFPKVEFPDVGAVVGEAMRPITAQLTQLEQRLDGLGRDETSAKVVALVEERIDAIIRAVGDRADKVATDVASLLNDRDAVTRRVSEIDVALTQLRASVENAAGRTEALTRQLDELRRAVEQSTERSADVIRREAELLTQRVASLAVGVEATRGMSEQIASAYEQSITRRAGVVGRRLARDLGLTGRRAAARGDRELGRGGE